MNFISRDVCDRLIRDTPEGVTAHVEIIAIRIKVLPDKRKEISQTIQSLVRETQNKSGCLSVEIYQVFENENEFLIVEHWATKQDVEAHQKSETFLVLQGAGVLMQEKPQITSYKVDSQDPEKPVAARL